MTDPRRPDLSDERDDDQDVQREHLKERLRAAFIEGAEEDSPRRLGRGSTAEKPERALRRHPGNL